MSWESLIPFCIEVLSTYNPVTDSVDTHFEKHEHRITDENAATFIQQVFYGVNRYREFLKALTKAIFRVHATSTNSNDTYPFMIFSYLGIFRFDELGLKNFARLVETQQPLKMHVLLNFLFNPDLLREHVAHKWCELYDYKYVHQEIIAKLETRATEAQELLNHLASTATNTALETKRSEQSSKKTFTTPQPFYLTKPKPRKLPVPLEIPVEVRASPISPNLFKYSLETLKAKKQERKKKLLEATVEKYSSEDDLIKRLYPRKSA